MAKTRRSVHPEERIHPMVSEAFFALVPIEDRDFKISESTDEQQTPLKSKRKKKSLSLAEEHELSKMRTKKKRSKDAYYREIQSAKRIANKTLMAEVRNELSDIQEEYSYLRSCKARLESELKTETDSYELKKIRYTIRQIDIDLGYNIFCSSIARRTPGKNRSKNFSRKNKASTEAALSKLKDYESEAEDAEKIEEDDEKYFLMDFLNMSDEEFFEMRALYL